MNELAALAAAGLGVGNLAAIAFAVLLWRAGWPWPALVAAPGARMAVTRRPAPGTVGDRCWNPWCVLRGCDGANHVNPHNHAWHQPQGWEWDESTRSYVPPQER